MGKAERMADDHYELCLKVDELHRLLNFAVAMLENGFEDDDEMKDTFLNRCENMMIEYYHGKLPIEQYKKLNG